MTTIMTAQQLLDATVQQMAAESYLIDGAGTNANQIELARRLRLGNNSATSDPG